MAPTSPRAPGSAPSGSAPSVSGRRGRPAGMPTGKPVPPPPRGQGHKLGDPELMQALGAVREQLTAIPADRRDDARAILMETAGRLRGLAG